MHLFRSATLKLTTWYLAILMAISIAFSIMLYQLSLNQVGIRLEALQHSILDGQYIQNLVQPYIQGLIPGSTDALIDTELQAASRQIITLLVKVNAVVLFAGGIVSYIMARRTLRPIEAAHEAQGRFTSDASHELRTPLSAMKAELEVSLRDPQLSISEARELLESNLEEVNKLISISEMLLHLSRLEYDQLEVTTVDVPALVADMLKKHPEGERFTLTSRKKATTRANEAAITEVIDILMENALKYSPKDRPITIKIFEQRAHIVFRIKNNGPAISKQSIDRIFERFYRGDQSRTNSSRNGYGLGLSIAKKIVEIHGGYITVSSNTKETSFTFYLPIVKKSSAK